MRTGLVLGGGSARGAYEAGVIAYLREELVKDLGEQVLIDIVTGTSVGAINACFVAATTDDPSDQGRRLVDSWLALKLENVLAFGVGDIFRVLREAFGKTPMRWSRGRHGGLVDPRGLEAIVGKMIPWTKIGRNLRSGALSALAVSATHVATGKTTIFLQTREKQAPPWSRDPNIVAVATRIGPKHALASAAIPLLFPAVVLSDGAYVDGGLRQNVPLSPALRLGARRVIVISLRHEEPPPSTEKCDLGMELRVASAPFLIGKALNAFLLDHTEQDLNRLRRINAILDAGTRAYGSSFENLLNGALVPHRNQPVNYVRNILVRPSRDIGKLAAEYARSSEFRKRATGLAGRVVRRLAESEAPDEADLASYLLFDGGFAEILVDLGKQDARAKRDQWLRFFSPVPESEAEAATLESLRTAAGGQ